MPGKLAYFIGVILLLALFMGFNLYNRCDVSLIVYVFKDVPIFLTMIVSFLLGTLSVLPFLFCGRKKTKKTDERAAPAVEKVEAKNEKTGWFGKKKKQKDANGSAPNA